MGADAERRVFDAVAPTRTSTDFIPINVGRLVQNRATLVAVHAVRRDRAARALAIPIAGTRAVVIGRSDIVGKPMALLLLHRHATVTDLPFADARPARRVAREADILVAAIGRPAFVTRDFVKPGAAVIDVGTIARRAIARSSNGSSRPVRSAATTFERRGSLLIGRRSPGRRRGRRRADARARRRRPADDRRCCSGTRCSPRGAAMRSESR